MMMQKRRCLTCAGLALALIALVMSVWFCCGRPRFSFSRKGAKAPHGGQLPPGARERELGDADANGTYIGTQELASSIQSVLRAHRFALRHQSSPQCRLQIDKFRISGSNFQHLDVAI